MFIWGDHDRFLTKQLTEASACNVPQLCVESVNINH